MRPLGLRAGRLKLHISREGRAFQMAVSSVIR